MPARAQASPEAASPEAASPEVASPEAASPDAPPLWRCVMSTDHALPEAMCLKCDRLFCGACYADGFSCPRCRGEHCHMRVYADT